MGLNLIEQYMRINALALNLVRGGANENVIDTLRKTGDSGSHRRNYAANFKKGATNRQT